MIRLVLLPLIVLGACAAAGADSATPPKDVADCYLPVEGGWRIRITADPAALRLKPGEAIGVVGEDDGRHCHKVWGHGVPSPIPDPEGPRMHRRPLYPPADRTLVWSKEELAKRERIPFRPLILAANEPRFLIDLDSAGGLSGHLLLGLSLDQGPSGNGDRHPAGNVQSKTNAQHPGASPRFRSKWLHQSDDLDVRYVEGRMEYAVRDAAFPGVTVRLVVLPLAESVGLVAKFRVEGLSKPGQLVWTFGGASGFTTNYHHWAPQYRFAPDQCGDNAIRWENGRFTLLRKGTAVMRGGGSRPDGCGLGDPRKVMDSPAAVLASARWCSAEKTAEEAKCVALQRISLGKEPVEGWIVIGRGGNIESCLADPRGRSKPPGHGASPSPNESWSTRPTPT